MPNTTFRTPEQKEKAKHGEQMFPLQRYITTLHEGYPAVTAHWHDEAEFTQITEGSAIYQIQLETYEVAAGDFIFIPPGVLHSITMIPGNTFRSETYVFHMHFLGMGTADVCAVRYLTPLSTQKLIPIFCFPPSHFLYGDLSKLFDEISKTYASAAPGYELFLKADFLKLIAILIPHCEEATSQPQLQTEHTAKLKTVLEYIEQHYAEELFIADLAALCYFSEYHFMRFFKKYVGMSCLDYIKNLRLEKAAELLEQEASSTLDISLSVGFRNLSYFHREFKKKYGVTPKKFMAQHFSH